jgi:hypothetical protein
MSPNKPSSKQSGPTTKHGRLVVYDREIFIRICKRLVDGEDLRAICAEPGMPIGPMFLGWVQDHKEAREIHRSARNLESDRMLSEELGLSAPTTGGEWEEQVRANIARGWPADYIERGHIPPDWRKVYPEIGGPPVFSTESREAYDNLINSMTQMLEPRDEMELIWTKQATDAIWESQREGREKTGVPEAMYQQRLQVEAQCRRQRGAAEAPVAKPATALDHSRGMRGGFKYYQGFDVMQLRKFKIHNSALRQIERWRDGLGATARRLPDRFIAEELLAERYGVDLLADAEIDAAAGESVDADQAHAPPHDDAKIAAPAAPAGEPAEVAPPLAPPLAPAGEAAEAAHPFAAAPDEMEAAGAMAAVATGVKAAPSLASATESPEAAPPLAPAADVAEAAPQRNELGYGSNAAAAAAAEASSDLIPSADTAEAAPLAHAGEKPDGDCG